MFKMFLWILLSIAIMLGPITVPVLQQHLNYPAQVIVSGFGFLMFIGGLSVVTITRLYIRPAANEAFVRTGMGGTQVVLDGGAYLIPVVHQLVKVPLTTTRLDVDRSGPDSLITADKLRADLKAEFYIRVMPQVEDIKTAARSFGDLAGQPQRIAQIVNDKLISALRSVAANKTLEELNTRRNEFAAEVKQQVEADLKHNGLTLETVTISKLDQTDPKNLKADNVFDAQGLKRITEITTEAAVRRNELEQAAQQAIKERNVKTRQQVLLLEQQQAEAEANQQAQVAKVKAVKDAEARQAQIEQEQAVQEREVERVRAIKAAELDAQKKVLESERVRELADVEKQKAIETANQEKQIAVAQAQAQRAQAEEQQYARMAEREKSVQQVETVKVTAAAERDGEQKLIAASKAAEQELVREQRKADAAAYKVLKEAEAKKAAAQAEYEARLKAAEAEAEAAKKRAEGATAEAMVQVTVQQKQVEVEQQRVEVEGHRLSIQESYGRAAIELQLRMRELEVAAQVEVARAQALGTMLSRGNFTIYGDPATLSNLAEAFNKGMGFRQMAEGFLSGQAGASPLGGLVSAAADLAAKLTRPDGAKAPADQPAAPPPAPPMDQAAPADQAAPGPTKSA
ncbi:MAG: hypothetical protein HY815_06985 [Candidatus Riflebacteria bacterium]|nr:hypothetical protein [Candidatus Riflebacteria bacterium]